MVLLLLFFFFLSFLRCFEDRMLNWKNSKRNFSSSWQFSILKNRWIFFLFFLFLWGMKKISISLFEIWISWSFGYHYLDNLITNNLYTYKYRKLWIIENEHTISKQKQQERRPTEIGESLLESKHDLDLFFFSPTILLLPFFFSTTRSKNRRTLSRFVAYRSLSLTPPPAPPNACSPRYFLRVNISPSPLPLFCFWNLEQHTPSTACRYFL